MNKSKPFSGRVIFDHLGKTGGMAVAAWLKESLGSGTVTETLVGTQSELIRRYGGMFPIISAHISFDGGLDPRYQYVTLLREPIDRVSSWLFYAANTVADSPEFAAHKKAAREFLRSDGAVLSDDIISSVSNYYVGHFSQIQKFSGITIGDDVDSALAVLRDYQVVGIYEQFSQFLSDLSDLIGLPAPQSINRVNVTNYRSPLDQLSPALRDRIVALNQGDLKLYAEVAALGTPVDQPATNERFSLDMPQWQKFELTRTRIFTTPDIYFISARIREGSNIQHGHGITFDVDFFLVNEVENLELGIHLFDSNQQWAFGINTGILEQPHKLLADGLYRASYYLLADLPAGTYTAGFSMTDRLADGQKHELAWYDVICDFQIIHPAIRIGVGHSNLPATIRLKQMPLPTQYKLLADDERLRTEVGSLQGNFIRSVNKAGYLIFGPYVALAAGDYRVTIYGEVGAGGLGTARMDVALSGGGNILGEAALTDQNNESQLISLPFSLDEFCHDLEIRVWVDEESDLSISSVDIQAQ
jgi:hypothetical protein